MSGIGTSRRRGTKRRKGIGIDGRQRLLARVGASDDGIRILGDGVQDRSGCRSRVAVAARVRCDNSSHRKKRYVVALQLAVHARPTRLLDPPMGDLAAPAGVERRVQRRIVRGLRQRPAEARGLRPLQDLPRRRALDRSRRAISCVDRQEDIRQDFFTPLPTQIGYSSEAQ